MDDNAAHDERETMPEVEVSFADVAAEEPEASVAREADATEELDGANDEPSDPRAYEDNAPPVEPTISSLTGGGPLVEGSELAP